MFSLPIYIQPYFVIVLLFLVLTMIYKNKLSTIRGMFLLVILFLIFDIVTVEDIFKNVSNPSISTILILIILAGGLMKAYPVLGYIEKILITRHGYVPFLGSIMFITGIASSILNNTAVVAALTPVAYNWGMKNRISPGKLLMPLSFAAISGGMITIIGTSTTLVLNGMMLESGLFPLDNGFLLICGTVVLILCTLYFIFFGQRNLPENEDLLNAINTKKKDYLIELKVKNNSSLAGMKVKEAGLRQLDNFYLAEVIRNGESIAPVNPEMHISEADILIFAGNTTQIKTLLSKNPGLELPLENHNDTSFQRISEIVISHNSGLTGQSVKQSDFRQRYDAAIIAIHRNGTQLNGKIGDIVLTPGDVLLVFSGEKFKNKLEDHKDFYLISENENPIRKEKSKNYPLIIILGVILASLIFQKPGLTGTLIIISGVLMMSNLLPIRLVKNEFDVHLAGILICSLVLGQAVLNSGAGTIIANSLIHLTGGNYPFALIALIASTVLLTSFVSNIAAVTIAFPIAAQMALEYPLQAPAFFTAIAFAASAAFLTPISYQTNLMVAGPGGYKFSDFFRNGIQFSLLYIGALYTLLLVWF